MIVIVCAAVAMLAVIASVAVLRNRRQSIVLSEVRDMPMSSEVRTKPLEHKSMSVVESSGVSCSYAACVVCGADAAIANRYETRNDALRSIARRRDLPEGDVAAQMSRWSKRNVFPSKIGLGVMFAALGALVLLV